MSSQGGYYGNQQQQQQQQQQQHQGGYYGSNTNNYNPNNYGSGYSQQQYGNSNPNYGYDNSNSNNPNYGGSNTNYGSNNPNYGGGNSYQYGAVDNSYHSQQQPPPAPGYVDPYNSNVNNNNFGVSAHTEDVYGGGNRDLYDDTYATRGHNQGNMYGLHPAATPPSSDPYAGRVPVNGIPYPSGYPLYNPDNLRRTPYDPYYAVTQSSTTISEDPTTTSASSNGYVKFGGSGGDEDGPGGATVGILVVVSILCILIFVFGLVALLRKRNRDPREDVIYTSAPGDPAGASYAPGGTGRQFSAMSRDVSCLNCKLIEMGSMACYQELCPQCGRPPPNR